MEFQIVFLHELTVTYLLIVVVATQIYCDFKLLQQGP